MRAAGTVAQNAPLPAFTSITRNCKPAASFFDRMLAVISGTDSTVAVTSRIAYSRLSAGAMRALAPTIAQPASRSVRVSRARDGATS